MGLSVDTVRIALRETAKAALVPGAEPEWTTSILQALAGLAEPDMCIDPDVSLVTRGRGRRAKEFLWDLTISSWPRYDRLKYEYPTYFASAEKPQLLLVAESEWGDARSPRKNGHAVLEDFVKLLAARAPLKVMVFGYHERNSSFAELTDQMMRLAHASDDPADYVLFGVAWKGSEYRDVHLKNGQKREEHVGPVEQ